MHHPSNPPDQRRRHKNIVLVCLLAVCLGPILFAWTIYKNSDHFQIQQKRAGQLIQPMVLANHLQYQTPDGNIVPATSLKDKWWIIYTAPKQCDETCHQRITEINQVKSALGKNVDRVGLIYLMDEGKQAPEWLEGAFPDVRILMLTQAQRLHYYLAYALPSASHVGAVFLMDPEAHIMMHYDHTVEAKGILSDLKRLFRVAEGGH